MRYRDRTEAGRLPARRPEDLRGRDVVVLGLPWGGVPVLCEPAAGIGTPLHVRVVRRPGVPRQPERGFAAPGGHGVRAAAASGPEAAASPAPTGPGPAADAPGATASAAPPAGPAAAPPASPAVSAVPVAPTGSPVPVAAAAHAGPAEPAHVPRSDDPDGRGPARPVTRSGHGGPRLATPGTAGSGPASSPAGDPPPASAGPPPPAGREVDVPAGRVRLAGRLSVPGGAPAVVAFAHGSGSSRRSPRNRYVAQALNRAGLGTLLLDLLTETEERDRHNVFDVRMLAGRLHATALWLSRECGLPVAFFGASTGAAAALEAAVMPGADVLSVVARGGRPDLASPAALAGVRAPTLLVVGSHDTRVLSLNRLAADWMRCEHRIAVVQGATHLFPEPGALATVASLACDWFTAHPARPTAAAPRG